MRPLPFKGILDQLLLRAVVLAVRRQVRAVSGLENIQTARPFILAVNHSSRREAVVVPAMLVFYRGGRLIHFWSDWALRLVPELGLLLKRAGTIPVTTKPARPEALDVFRRFYAQPRSAMEQARILLEAGNASASSPRAPSTVIRAGCCPGVSALLACRWRPACRSCRSVSASPISIRNSRCRSAPQWKSTSARRWRRRPGAAWRRSPRCAHGTRRS